MHDLKRDALIELLVWIMIRALETSPDAGGIPMSYEHFMGENPDLNWFREKRFVFPDSFDVIMKIRNRIDFENQFVIIDTTNVLYDACAANMPLTQALYLAYCRSCLAVL